MYYRCVVQRWMGIAPGSQTALAIRARIIEEPTAGYK
jgi:hypothetical protein